VIPWVGYSLSEFIKQCEPLSTAKYVQFLSYYDKHVENIGHRESIISCFTLRGLRMERGDASAGAADLWLVW